MTIPGVNLAPPSLINPSPNSGQVIPIAAWQREPLPTDTKYPIGFVVIIGKNPTTGTQGDLWYLSKFVAGVPIWKQFATGDGPPGIDGVITDDGLPAVQPDVDGNISVVGGTGVVTSGQGPGSTVTIAVDTSVVTTSYAGNTGTATPTAGVINIIGTAPMSSAASGNTINFSVAIADNAETIAGAISNKVVVPSGLNAKLGAQTANGVAYGGGSSSALQWTSANTANSILIGGAPPQFSTTANIYLGSLSFNAGTSILNRYDNVTLFTPSIAGSSSAGTATYTSQYGAYSRIGNMVVVQINLEWTGHTGTGDMLVTGFPFIFAAAASFYPMATMVQNIVLPAGALSVVTDGINATTTAEVACSIDNAPIAQVQMDAAGSVFLMGAYLTDP